MFAFIILCQYSILGSFGSGDAAFGPIGCLGWVAFVTLCGGFLALCVDQMLDDVGYSPTMSKRPF